MNKAALFFQTKDNNFEEVLKSPNHALDVIRRLLQTSGMILDYSNPILNRSRKCKNNSLCTTNNR